jgi:short-subunit dehydrogenase
MKRSFATAAQLFAVGASAAIVLNRLLSPGRVRAGQVAIITGGSRGLGLALAHRFGRAGLKLAIAARDADELDRALDELVSRGSVSDRNDVLLSPCDLREPAEAEGLVSATLDRFGHLDVLINNAGVIVVGPAVDQPLAAYREAMDVDFFAALHCIYAALPTFLQQQSGAIVNIASIGGKMAVPHLLPYVAAKFALTGLSEGLHAELRHRGVRVTTVCPGLMRTGGEVHAKFRGQVEKEKAWFQLSARTPVLAASAAHAASKIFAAVDAGRAEITITPQAWLAARFAGLAPETTQWLAAEVNEYFLPAPSQESALRPDPDSGRGA